MTRQCVTSSRHASSCRIAAESRNRWPMSHGGAASGTGASRTSTKPSGLTRATYPCSPSTRVTITAFVVFPKRCESLIRFSILHRTMSIRLPSKQVSLRPRATCRGPRQVALGLSDTCFEGKRIDIVRCNIENLIKLSQRFGKTTKAVIVTRVLGEQGNVARVKPLGFVEVRLAPVPLAAPPCDIGQRFRDSAAIRQELACLLE